MAAERTGLEPLPWGVAVAALAASGGDGSFGDGSEPLLPAIPAIGELDRDAPAEGPMASASPTREPPPSLETTSDEEVALRGTPDERPSLMAELPSSESRVQRRSTKPARCVEVAEAADADIIDDVTDSSPSVVTRRTPEEDMWP